MPAFDLSTFPVLVTSRLVLRQIAAEDSADLFGFLSDPEVQKYDSEPPLGEAGEAAALIEKMLGWYHEGQALNWGVTQRGENRLVGFVGFYFWDRVYFKADLGYTLARPYWGQGFASEAVRALIWFGFEKLELHRINVDTRMDNLASLRLMERLSFRHEGTRRECERSRDGSYQNWGLFGMLEDEYRALALARAAGQA